MARSAPPLETMTQSVAAIESRIEAGARLEDAIAECGLNRSTYYRWRKLVRAGVWPAVRKDWPDLARTWKPGGGLTRLGKTRLRRLRREVAGALRQIYGHSVQQQSGGAPESLVWFVSCFSRACEAYEALGDFANELLVDMREQNEDMRSFSSLFEAARALEPRLAATADAWEDHAEEATIYGGGPIRDPRVARLVMALATIWRQYSGKPPSHTINPDSQRSVSRFNKFVGNVRRHFLSDQQISTNALTDAMRHTAARLDWE